VARLAALRVENGRHERELEALNAALEQQVRERTRDLHESEASFRHFFDSMVDIAVVAAADGRILSANRAARDRLAYSHDELMGMHLLDWHRQEDRPEAEGIFADILAGRSGHCPLPLVAKDGTVVPVETRVWFGSWHGRDCVFGICRDLTSEQEAQQRFERVFRRNPLPMALSSMPDRRFTDANDAFVQTTGYTVEEIVGRTPAELHLTVDPEAHGAAAEALRGCGSISGVELGVRCRDGSIRDGVFSGELIRSQGRELLLTVMQDITERTRSERALRESEARNRLLSDVTIEGIVIHRDAVAADVNASMARMLGCGREELLGRDFLEFVDPDDVPLVRTKMAEDHAAPYVVRARRRDGSSFPAERSRVPELRRRERHLARKLDPRHHRAGCGGTRPAGKRGTVLKGVPHIALRHHDHTRRRRPPAGSERCLLCGHRTLTRRGARGLDARARAVG
jgi:PAS domain S-box-containing protein